MTDEQVIRILAEKEGVQWSPLAHVPYLTSKDALAPVLEKLSENEWERLSDRMNHLYAEDDKFSATTVEQLRHALTLSARDLACVIAEAITQKP